MIENENESSEPQPEAITEGTSDPGLDLFLNHWPRIAATAWGGFVSHGRGAVLMRRTAPHAPVFEYQAGAPCDCHDELISDYDPDRQAVVAVVKGRGRVVWIATLGGWPSPKDAWERVSAAEMNATVQ
ncbi:MAG TPA: hypothetical protein VGR62_03195 [Candidatus Binatia bacterium]|nr:hypothetical protein [Candidatus Binatia bacterium]